MPRKPKVRFNAQPKKPRKVNAGSQSKAAITSAQIGMREAKRKAKESAAKTIKIPSPNSQDRNQLLLDRGISVVRPEIIAATEFIPLVKDDDPSDATFTMTAGDKEFKVDVSNAARLLEMQVVAQTMLYENIREVLSVYAGDDIIEILDQFLTYLNGEYDGEIKADTLNNMKRQVREAMENAYSVLPKNTSKAKIKNLSKTKTFSNLSKTLSKTVTEAKLDNSKSIKRSILSNLRSRFKRLDSKYQDLLIEYVARFYLVKHTNFFLAEMGKSKISLKKSFNILESDPGLLMDASSRRIKLALEYNAKGTAAGGAGARLSPTIKSYITNTLISETKQASKANSTRNFMHVLKALSADMQFEKRANAVNYSSNSVPVVVDTRDDLKKEYSEFNVADFFGDKNKLTNMVTGRKSGQNFSDNAYDRVRTIIEHNQTNFGRMFGFSGLTPNNISDKITDVFARCLVDITLHNNFSKKNSAGDFKVIAANQAETGGSTNVQVNFNVGSYCKTAIYNKDLESSQNIADMFLSDNTNNGIVPDKLAKSFKMDRDNSVLPFEQNFANLDIGDPYIPGGSYFFDSGIKEMSEGEENEIFTDLTDFSRKINKTTEDILSDFNMMRGISDNDKIGIINSEELLDSYNERIASWLDKYFNKKKPDFDDLFFWLIVEKCTNDSYFLTTFLTYLKLMEFQLYQTGQDAKGYKNQDGAINNAFGLPYHAYNDNRELNFQKREGKDERKSKRKYMTLMKYCASHMFMEIASDILGQKKKDRNKGLGDDFYISKKDIKRKVGMLGLGKSALEQGAPIDMKSANAELFWASPWAYFLNALNSDCLSALRPDNARTEEAFQKIIPLQHGYEKEMNKRSKDNLNRVIGSKTGAGDTKEMITNGGNSRFQASADVYDDKGNLRNLVEHRIPLNTNRERTYLGLNSTKDMRGAAHLMYFLSIMSRMNIFRVEVFKENQQLRIKIYRKAIKSAIAALRGEGIDSDVHSRTVYNNVRSTIESVRSKIVKNNKDCLNHLMMMKAQAVTMRSEVREIKKFIRGVGTGNKYRRVLDVFDQSGIGRQLLSFVGPSMIASNKYSQLKLMTGGKNFPHMPACDVITSKQLKNMMTFFNQKTRGFHAKEGLDVLNGRKSVMHVGIPAGMLENLQFEAIRQTGESLYEGSNLIMMTIHRKDVLNSRAYVYPKTFIFDMSRFVIDYSDNFTASQVSDQDFLSSEDLLKNSQIFKIDGLGYVHNLPAGKAYHKDSYGIFKFENQPGYSDKFQKDIFHNHLTDHYLKMYYKFLLGLDFDEYIYQLTSDSAIRNGPDQVNIDLLNEIIKNNESVFPDAFEDMDAARELFKINTGIANTLFFNSERYTKAALYPNAFDRVFSVLINERDFIHYTGNVKNDKSAKNYGNIVGNIFRTNCVAETFNDIRKPLSNMTLKEKYYNKTRNKDFPQVYMYYAEISILKRIEEPSF